MSFRGNIRSIFRFFFLLAILGTVALISFLVTVRFTIHGPQEDLPNLAGQALDKAQHLLEARGLDLKVEDHLYSSTVPLNGIISQIPPPGTPVRAGQHVHVLVSLGPPMANIPNLVGSNFRAARVSAIQQGLTIGDIASLYWPDSKSDEILGQEPPAASKDVRSPAMDFLVSLGAPQAAYLCPSFIGKPIASAKRDLAAAGFKTVEVTSIPTPGMPAGTVIKQVPVPGTRITPEMTFDLQVAQ